MLLLLLSVAAAGCAGTFVTQYSLDASAWVECGSQLRLGPLAPGPHVLQVQCASLLATRAPSRTSDRVTHEWVVWPALGNTLLLPGLPDGPVRLAVTAAVPHLGANLTGPTAPASRVRWRLEEALPRTYTWTVDTAPPTTRVVLLSPRLSSGRDVTVAVACSGSGACSYCWRMRLGGRFQGSGFVCQPPAADGTLTLAAPANGVVDLHVRVSTCWCLVVLSLLVCTHRFAAISELDSLWCFWGG